MMEARPYWDVNLPFGTFVRNEARSLRSRMCVALSFRERNLNTNQKLACAISAMLSGYSGASHAAAAADTEAAGGIEEIVVTAQRRNESIQDVPVTIQAITGEQLGQLNVTTFDDVLKYLPNVTFSSNGPGQGNIYMRGLSAGFAGNQSSAAINPFPNVATYLDDQSMAFPARNVDVYMADMERIEVLEGPQGTLFGGGAEAGAIRYITNKPKLNVTEGNAEASYGTTAHGDPNTAITAVLNLPLIQDTLAVRAVIYNDRRGGYIDNVPSQFTRFPTDPGTISYHLPYPANAATANNYSLAARAQNPVTYQGIRASALWQINNDWNVLIQQSYQNMDAEGMDAQYPLEFAGDTARPLAGDFIHAGLRQGQVGEHVLDRQRQGRRPEAGVHGRLPRPHDRQCDGLHELRALGGRVLLHLRRRRRPHRQGSGTAHLLLAGLVLAGPRRNHAPEP